MIEFVFHKAIFQVMFNKSFQKFFEMYYFIPCFAVSQFSKKQLSINVIQGLRIEKT